MNTPKNGSSIPLFIPLRNGPYAAFASGEKTIEYRPHGPRWNERTIWPGRPVILSCGYGKARRMMGVVICLRVTPDALDIPAWRAIYGDRPGPVCRIHIRTRPVTNPARRCSPLPVDAPPHPVVTYPR